MTSGFVTVPKIIGQAQLGSVVKSATATADQIDIVANPVDIYIYHPTIAGPGAAVTLPGVIALQETFNDVDGSADRTQVFIPGSKKVIGNNGAGVDFNGDLKGEIFYEDGGPLTPEQLGKIHVMVKYKGLYKDNTKAAVISSPSSSYEQLVLTTDHMFTDNYTSNFLGDGTYFGDNTKVPYSYGIDPLAGRVNIPISMGTQNGGFDETYGYPAKWNTTIYLSVPFDKDNYRYIRGIKLDNLNWGTEAEPYVLQTTAMANSVTDWETFLMGSARDLKLEVSYWGTEDTNIRDRFDFLRAYRMNRAGVYNEPVKAVNATTGLLTGAFKSQDDDDFGKIYIGYYSSLPDPKTSGDWRDPIEKGDFTNIVVEDIPIALFVEGSGTLEFQTNAYPKENLIFVQDRQNTGANMSAQELEAIRNTYEFNGNFVYGSYAPKKARIIPGSDFQTAYFSPRKPFVTTEPTGELIEVTFTVPALAVLRTLYTDAKAAEYAVYTGEEASFSAMVYPLPGDVH